jgi:tetratricopeptide (TPR) repeat protein
MPNAKHAKLFFSRLSLLLAAVAILLASAGAFAQSGETVSPEDQLGEDEEEAGSWDPDQGVNVTAIFDEATELANSGQTGAAIEKYKEVANVDPYWEDAFYNVGVLSAESGNLVDCVLYLQRYLQLRPDGEDSQQVSRRLHRCESSLGQTGILRVPLTNPADAMVSINGVPLGEGGIERIELPPGTYTIGAKRVDYEPYETQVRVRANESTAQDITMTAKDLYGRLSINVDQPDVNLTVDGEQFDWQQSVDNPIQKKVGRYYIKAEKDGFYRWHRYVNIYRDATTNVTIEMISEDRDLEELLGN